MRRPFSNGLLVAANYMWSHEIDNGSNGSGDGDEIHRRIRCAWPAIAPAAPGTPRHVVNGNAVYQLPFGHGKPLLNQGGIASAIAGNWELTTTALARTGFPGQCADAQQLHRAGWGLRHGASRSGSRRFSHSARGQDVAEWINPAAFATPAGEFGTAPRDLLRGPGTWQIDMGAGKTIPLRERGQIEFRAEFYNIFNHPQLGQPQSTFNPSNTTGFGSIINTVNLNTAIVSPITPVGSGTPREMQFALRLEF
jgi:hypothetical protein